MKNILANMLSSNTGFLLRKNSRQKESCEKLLICEIFSNSPLTPLLHLHNVPSHEGAKDDYRRTSGEIYAHGPVTV